LLRALSRPPLENDGQGGRQEVAAAGFTGVPPASRKPATDFEFTGSLSTDSEWNYLLRRVITNKRCASVTSIQ